MKLDSTYLGLKMKSPIMVSACTLSAQVANIKKMEDLGAGGVVLFSLFEEQIRQESAFYDKLLNGNGYTDTQSFTSTAKGNFHYGGDEYLELIREAKEKTDLPIIASLNCVTPEGWNHYAKIIEEAGADAIEVNVYFIPAYLKMDGRTVEQRYLDIVKKVKETVKIPVAIKLHPYFSATAHMAAQLADAGADGLVLFNRFYQPDFDLKELKVVSDLELSTHTEIRLPLLWISVLYGRVLTNLAATTGVQGAREVVKFLLAGADTVMTASALYRFGIDHLKTMNDGLIQWMDSMGFDTVDDFRGKLAQTNVMNPTAFERANYIKILEGMK